jgi:hypothetical protein
MSVTVCYFNAVGIFFLEPEGTRGRGEGAYALQYVLCKPVFKVKNSFENLAKSSGK